VEAGGFNVYPEEHWLQLTESLVVLLQAAHPALPTVQEAKTMKQTTAWYITRVCNCA